MEAEVNSEMAYCVLLDTRPIRFKFFTVVECVIFLALLMTDKRLVSKETRKLGIKQVGKAQSFHRKKVTKLTFRFERFSLMKGKRSKR